MTANNVLKWFFWCAFASFLLASISHVAYFFRAFEPQDSSWYWWAVAYAIAVSIDITIFLLSLTVAELRGRKVSNWIVASVWIFIAGLAGLSWFINWQYAFEFTSNMLNRPAGIWWVALINPIVASCFQALAIAYTWISDKIAQSGDFGNISKVEVAPAAVTAVEVAPEPLMLAPARVGKFPSKEQEIKAILAQQPGASVTEIATLAQCSERTAAKWLERLNS